MIGDRLNRIQKLLSASAESFRGGDMDTYLALERAAAEVVFAIEAADKAALRTRPPAVQLANAFSG